MCTVSVFILLFVFCRSVQTSFETKLCRSYCTNKSQVCRLSGGQFRGKDFYCRKVELFSCNDEIWAFLSRDDYKYTPWSRQTKARCDWLDYFLLPVVYTFTWRSAAEWKELEICLVCDHFNTIWMARERAPIRSFSSSSKSNPRSKGFSSWCIIWRRFAG